MRKLSIYYTFLAILSVILASCTVTNNLDLKDGTNEADVEITDTLKLVIDDYQALFSQDSESGPSYIETAIDEAGKALSGVEGISDTVVTGEGNHISLSFSIDDVESLLSYTEGLESSLFSLDGNTFSFSLSIDNYSELTDLIPLLKDPNFEVYGPEYNQGMSEEEYIEMMSYILGESAPEDIRGSNIAINVRTPGRIVNMENMEKTSDDSALFSVPLVSFLVLAEPITFSITWE